MIVNSQLAASKGCDQKDKWATPFKLFKKLNDEFLFTLDPCAEYHTAKCDRFYTEEQDGLAQSWTGDSVFVNPPYSRGNIDKWVEKCYLESLNSSTVVVALLPVSTSSDWWHNWIVNKAHLRFVKRRVRFDGAPFTAPFSSVIAVFNRTGISTFHQDY